MSLLRQWVGTLAGAMLAVSSIAVAGDIPVKSVQFARGASSATIRDRIKGDQTIDYSLHAKAGQTLKVSLATKHGANYFNVLPPGSNDAAIFIGQIDGNDWVGTLPQDGEYKVRVYLMRSAARRNEVANYTLTVGLAGAAGAAGAADMGKAPAGDAKVKGTPFHATGALPCAMGNDKPVQCAFGVIRGKPGNAAVHVTLPGGLKRIITFMGDQVTTTPGAQIKAVRQGYDWSVEVNENEHYTIPEAVISGG